MIAAVVVGAAWAVLAAFPVARRARGDGARVRLRALKRDVRSVGSRARRAARVATRIGSGPVTRVVASVWFRVRRRRDVRNLERAVPLTLDVLTMASRAGLTPRLALRTTATWSVPAVRVPLDAVEQRCRLGASLSDALDQLARETPALGEVADVLAVAERNGAPTADLIGRLADDARVALRRRAEAHARRVPVRLLFPLVFLVLPAFGLLTVVPALLAGLRAN